MPYIELRSSGAMTTDKAQSLAKDLSALAASTIGKPERYVMAAVLPATMTMDGEEEGAAFVDVRSIGGLGGAVNKAIAEKACALVSETLGIAADRIYLNFTDVAASAWGWNGSTFG